MSTPQQKFYQNNREKVLAYKKEHYAKKTNKHAIHLFKSVQLKGKTKSESRRIIKQAVDAGAITIKHLASNSQTTWTPQQWIDNKCPPIREDQKYITVDYTENESVLEIILEPWMLVENFNH